MNQLNASFSLKDLRRLNFFLGIEVSYSLLGIHLNQPKNARDLISRCKLQDSKDDDTSMSTGKLLGKYDSTVLEDPIAY